MLLPSNTSGGYSGGCRFLQDTPVPIPVSEACRHAAQCNSGAGGNDRCGLPWGSQRFAPGGRAGLLLSLAAEKGVPPSLADAVQTALGAQRRESQDDVGGGNAAPADPTTAARFRRTKRSTSRPPAALRGVQTTR
ncbi:unnamed protein product [Scytosiphon promiscuus]